MPHGTPDWWGVEPTSTVHRVSDFGELAARLWSPDTYDRRGNVVWMDSFEVGLEGWISAFAGGSGGVVQSAKAYRTGAYSAKFTTGKDASGNASLSKYHPRPPVGPLGFEVSFAALSADPTIRLRFYHYDGSDYHLFSVRYDYPNKKLQYLDNTPDWVDLPPSAAFYPNITSWNVLKLVVDIENNNYYRVLLNDSEHDLGGIDAYTFGSETAPYLSLVIFADGDNDDNYTVYFDDVILTQNED